MSVNDYNFLFSLEEQKQISLSNKLYGKNTKIVIESFRSKEKKNTLNLNCYAHLQNLISGKTSIEFLTRKELLLMYIQLRLEKAIFLTMGMTDAKEIDSIIATKRKMILSELNARRSGR